MDEHRTSYRGKVIAISERMWEPERGTFNLELEDLDAPKPKKSKKGEPSIVGSAHTQSHTISAAMAKSLTVGDHVVCETVIRKVKRLKKKGNPGAKPEGY